MGRDSADDVALDRVDCALLHCIRTADEPVWKKAIHERFREQAPHLPGPDTLSLQSVGRRINRLHSEALLTSTITSPPHLQRDLIIAYALTADGERALEEKQKALLRDMAFQFDDGNGDKEPLITLLEETTGASPDLCTFLAEECAPAEVRAVATLYYVMEFVEPQIPQERWEQLHGLFDGADSSLAVL